jgi:hypothetical protein
LAGDGLLDAGIDYRLPRVSLWIRVSVCLFVMIDNKT